MRAKPMHNVPNNAGMSYFSIRHNIFEEGQFWSKCIVFLQRRNLINFKEKIKSNLVDSKQKNSVKCKGVT